MKKIYLLSSLLFFLQATYGQYQIGIIPRVSPDKAIYQKIGYIDIELRYGSPSVNNRPIWGELVPYDKVWRAGANSATTVEISAPIEVGGKSLDSGTYAFFLLPKENDTWTAIFNKVSKQWGAFRYDEKEDALRVEVRPRRTSYKTEALNYSIKQTGFKYGSILLAWEFMEIEVPFSTNYLDAFVQKIEERAKAQPTYIQWIPYLQGAEYLVEIKERKELAKQWIDKAESIMETTKEWNEQFYPRPYVKGHVFWTKAKVLAWEENYTEAIAYIDKLKSIEKGSFYTKQNEAEGIDELYEVWKQK